MHTPIEDLIKICIRILIHQGLNNVFFKNEAGLCLFLQSLKNIKTLKNFTHENMQVIADVFRKNTEFGGSKNLLIINSQQDLIDCAASILQAQADQQSLIILCNETTDSLKYFNNIKQIDIKIKDYADILENNEDSQITLLSLVQFRLESFLNENKHQVLAVKFSDLDDFATLDWIDFNQSKEEEKIVKLVENANFQLQPNQNWEQLSHSKGIILLGDIGLNHAIKVVKFAQKIGWIVLNDAFSKLNCNLNHLPIWIENKQILDRLSEVETILQFGSEIKSQPIQNCIKTMFKQAKNINYWVVTPKQPQLLQLKHSYFNCNATEWIEKHPPKQHDFWAPEPYAIDKFCHNHIVELLADSELNLTHIIFGLNQTINADYQILSADKEFLQLYNTFATPINGVGFYQDDKNPILGALTLASLNRDKHILVFCDEAKFLQNIDSLYLLEDAVYKHYIDENNSEYNCKISFVVVDTLVAGMVVKPKTRLDLVNLCTIFNLNFNQCDEIIKLYNLIYENQSVQVIRLNLSKSLSFETFRQLQQTITPIEFNYN